MSEQPSESARQAIVPDTAAGRRFDAVVAELFPEYSRSRLTEWIKACDVQLDGAQVRPRDPLRGGEVVTLNVELETQTHSKPYLIPLDVLYEQEHLLVLHNPEG
ncbi:S4 domain-containing protein, partial [Stutzerimonas stutzeri]|uniref:S4 domain-containing protein n=1 Tax=Stutzerimonas stutzeri TaxID=316 RepID=UPI002022E542